jgi:hypothetical protein
MHQLKKNVRFELEWKVDNSNGDCTARVTRSVLYGLQPNPVEESKFQIHVGKYVFSMYPWPGQKVFKALSRIEHDKLSAVARSFYAGVNKHETFYYWEMPEEDVDLHKGVNKVSVICDSQIKSSNTKRQKKKKGPNGIWQVTT